MAARVHHMFLIKENEYADTYSDYFSRYNWNNFEFHVLKAHFNEGLNSLTNFATAFESVLKSTMEGFQKNNKIEDFFTFMLNDVDFEVRLVHNGREVGNIFVIYDNSKSLYKGEKNEQVLC